MSVNAKMKAICDNIRLRTGGTALLTLDEIAEAILTIGGDVDIATWVHNAVGTTFPPEQLPADSRIDGSDVHANLYGDENNVIMPTDSVTSDDIHTYIDLVADNHKNRVTKEILGRDESGHFNIMRYTVCNRQHIAWQRKNYPKMYAWKNGDTVVYSESVSPRIDDMLYPENYVGGTGSATETKPATAVFIKCYRYSHSGGSFGVKDTVSSVVIPIKSNGTSQVFDIVLANDTLSTSYTYVYYGSDKITFPNNDATTNTSTEAYGGSAFTITNVPAGDWYFVFFITARDDHSNSGIALNGETLNVIVTDTPDDSIKAEFGTTEEIEVGSGYPVTDVSATNRSRTANGIEYVRYESGDVEPTLIYTDVYDERNENTTLTQDGVMYIRYPLGDLLSNKTIPIPIFVYANEHGAGTVEQIVAGSWESKLPALVASRILRDFSLEKHADNPLYKFIYENCMLIVIPVANPYGYNNHLTEYTMDMRDGYHNYNDCNINRNYDTPGWDKLIEENGAKPAWGEYPGSENETQYIMNTMVESGAVVAMSLHGLGGMLGSCAHQGQQPDGSDFNQEKLAKVYDILYNKYGIRLRYYDYVDGQPNPCANTPDKTSKSPSYITQSGAYGAIVELQPVPVGGNMGEMYLNQTVVETAYCQILNLMAMWLSDYLEDTSDNSPILTLPKAEGVEF